MPNMQKIDRDSGIDFELRASFPGLSTHPGAKIVRLAQTLAGEPALVKVAFGTEAVLFSGQLGVSCVVCGPGSIEQAHKPDEFVSAVQLEKCERFIDRLLSCSQS